MKNNKLWLILSGVLVVLIFGIFFGFKAYSERPQDLGPELEYIGKDTYGCYVFCDSPPQSSYYFSTNLSETELIKYFTNAELIEREDRTYLSSNPHVLLSFKTKNDGKLFGIRYLTGDELIQSKINLSDLSGNLVEVTTFYNQYMNARAGIK